MCLVNLVVNFHDEAFWDRPQLANYLQVEFLMEKNGKLTFMIKMSQFPRLLHGKKTYSECNYRVSLLQMKEDLPSQG